MPALSRGLLPTPGELLVPFPSRDSGWRRRVAGLGDELYRLVDGAYGAQADEAGCLVLWRRGRGVGGGEEDERVGGVLLAEGVGLGRGLEEGGCWGGFDGQSTGCLSVGLTVMIFKELARATRQ